MKNKWIVILLVISFLIRFLPINFPSFSADEARIAYRGYSLVKTGKDELGRKYPLIFNSSEDYQLPLTSYLTALGIGIFGKTELGARIPFIFIGSLIVWLTYLMSSLFTNQYKFKVLSTIVVAFSPILIYISKFPNEWIILITLLLLLFLNLTKSHINFTITFILIILLLSVSKIAWFILTPYVIYTLLFFKSTLSNKNKFLISVIYLILNSLVFLIFLSIPQSIRSLMENNFPIFSDITIKNGVDRLRGQGIEVGWPSFIEKLLFNKLNFIFVGFLHWLSNLKLATFFSQFDESGQLGFTSMGAWSKILIVPFLLSLINLVKAGGNKKLKLLLGYFILLTVPIIFLYPKNMPGIVSLTLPFMGLIIASGLNSLKKVISKLILFIMVLEILINLFYVSPQIKNTNNLRPDWIKGVVLDGYNTSQDYQVAFSDNITENIVSFFEWNTPIDFSPNYSMISFPYKFHTFKIGNIRIIGHDDSFYICGMDKPSVIFASLRDLNKIQNEFQININKIFKDNLGQDIVYKLESKICIK